MDKKRILIVEDDLSLNKALVEKFSKEEYEVLSAKDGAIGLQMALTDHPDIILLDIIMPVMDGMSMLRKVRRDAWGKSVPIIILTNLSSSEKVEEAIEKGVFDFLVKTDWSLSEVVKKVQERLV